MTLMVPSSKDGVAFSVGTSNASGDAMGKSLDEMIKDRRKQQAKDSKKPPKNLSTSERSIATGRAKREAAMRARRGLSESKKPSAMEVESQIYRQSRQSANQRKRQEKKATGGRIAPNSSLRDKKKGAKKAPPAAIIGGRTPSKKQVEAAIKGMESAGFKIPKGHQMVMTFVPSAPQPDTKRLEPRGKKAGGKKSGGRGKK